jgi:hypothetical protein
LKFGQFDSSKIQALILKRESNRGKALRKPIRGGETEEEDMKRKTYEYWPSAIFASG